MKQFTITEIIDYVRDESLIAGDKSHENPRDVDEVIDTEIEAKTGYNGSWPGLPFTCDAENEDDAVAQYNAECCAGDYILAGKVEYSTVEKVENESTPGISNKQVQKSCIIGLGGMHTVIYTSSLDNANDVEAKYHTYASLQLAEEKFNEYVNSLIKQMLDNKYLNCKMSIYKNKAVISIEDRRHVVAIVAN